MGRRWVSGLRRVVRARGARGGRAHRVDPLRRLAARHLQYELSREQQDDRRDGRLRREQLVEDTM